VPGSSAIDSPSSGREPGYVHQSGWTLSDAPATVITEGRHTNGRRGTTGPFELIDDRRDVGGRSARDPAKADLRGRDDRGARPSSSRSNTGRQLEASPNAPWTSTIVGLGHAVPFRLGTDSLCVAVWARKSRDGTPGDLPGWVALAAGGPRVRCVRRSHAHNGAVELGTMTAACSGPSAATPAKGSRGGARNRVLLAFRDGFETRPRLLIGSTCGARAYTRRRHGRHRRGREEKTWSDDHSFVSRSVPSPTRSDEVMGRVRRDHPSWREPPRVVINFDIGPRSCLDPDAFIATAGLRGTVCRAATTGVSTGGAQGHGAVSRKSLAAARPSGTYLRRVAGPDARLSQWPAAWPAVDVQASRR